MITNTIPQNNKNTPVKISIAKIPICTYPTITKKIELLLQ